MHQALYRKWRPQTFEDVCGQEHITSILKYEAEHKAWNHAYLFCGSRGTGKTTCAKILAKVMNCEHPVNGSPCGKCAACQSIDSGIATDVLEMDAASNNSVDNIRDIRDEVIYSPSVLNYRVYIIDEVHMLSGSAFNALLKTLEEPPEHAVFILATTELQKLPATIISRCQRFEFRRIPTSVLRDRLLYIAAQEGITIDADAATLIGKLAQGGMRDAISLLELCAGAHAPITVSLVTETLGVTGRDALFHTVRAIAAKDYDALYAQIDTVVQSSLDLKVFWQDLISLYRDMMIVKCTKNYAQYLDLTDAEMTQLTDACALFTRETLLYHQRLLESSYLVIQGANSLKRITAEMTLTRMCDERLSTEPEALLSRIAKLEDGLFSGQFKQSLSEKSAKEMTLAGQQATIDTPTPVPQAEQPTATADAPQTKDLKQENRVLRPFREWADVVDRVGQQDHMSAAFIRSKRAYLTAEGKVLLRFENEFTMKMLECGETKQHLRRALSVFFGKEVKEGDILYEIETKADAASPIDEIIEEIGDD